MQGKLKPYLFINYRTEDTGPTASRLYEALASRLQSGHVFLDYERIGGGINWPDHLRAEASQATVMFVLIGHRWLKAQDSETGDRRLNMPKGWVRQEIELALANKLHVVPILVENAPPLNPRSLQTLPSIAELADKQAMPLHSKDWQADFEALVQLLLDQGFPPLRREAAGTDKPSLRLVIDRVGPFRENRQGRHIVYGTVKLAEGDTAYGEGMTLQLTLENTSNVDPVGVIVRSGNDS